MSKIGKAAAGSVIFLVALYFVAAFVNADLWWMCDIWEWSRSGRAAIAYAAFCCLLLGSMFGNWVLFPSRHT